MDWPSVGGGGGHTDKPYFRSLASRLTQLQSSCPAAAFSQRCRLWLTVTWFLGATNQGRTQQGDLEGSGGERGKAAVREKRHKEQGHNGYPHPHLPAKCTLRFQDLRPLRPFLEA